MDPPKGKVERFKELKEKEKGKRNEKERKDGKKKEVTVLPFHISKEK